MTPIQKATRDIQIEGEKQVRIVYSAAAIALHRYHGWGQKRILQLIEETKTIWNDCARDPNTSMLMMLENETGIEIQARGVDKSYHDLDFLNGTPADARPMKPAEFLYMRKRQLPWINPQITAALLLALNRLHGWSGVRDGRLLRQKDEVEAEYKWNPARLVETCRAATGINIVEVTEK